MFRRGFAGVYRPLLSVKKSPQLRSKVGGEDAKNEPGDRQILTIASMAPDSGPRPRPSGPPPYSFDRSNWKKRRTSPSTAADPLPLPNDGEMHRNFAIQMPRPTDRSRAEGCDVDRAGSTVM
ncbi:hypothetical protein [Lyngbya sp. CCY1209]|uniref:hypothetical protein n=1 Tax=Lyngbya sp. CCY1209 TaxID=2886103 RepID=UPI002D20EA8C|nr:hypothetical protein [Lyngbya sp. CCY1209]MEB3882835.1 hypothetical protein [Lyngbya sp. CCY1209]